MASSESPSSLNLTERGSNEGGLRLRQGVVDEM